MSDVMLVGSRKGLLVYRRQAGGWKLDGHHFAGVAVSALLAEGGRWRVALVTAIFGPKLHESRDGGASWNELTAPAFPADTDGGPKVDQVWTLAGSGDALWAGCIPAGLFQSRDGGRSWELVESLWNRPERAKWFGGGYDDAGIHSVLVDPRNPNWLTLGISCGGVWDSEDGGEHWENRSAGLWAAYMPPESKEDPDVQDPHRLSQCRAHPQTIWCQHHNGQFVCNDDLGLWEEIWPAPPLSNFGFAVAAHPQDPKTAWFVPAAADDRRFPLEGDFYVLRTCDGGKTFDKLSAGLPPAPAFHLVYRHGLCVDDSGRRLAMASTTGSLWTSDDGGEQWQRVSAELPLVYCISFG